MDSYIFLMFPALLLLLVFGVPVAFAMFGIAVAFGLTIFDSTQLQLQLITAVNRVASDYILAAVALFVFMGNILERSGIAKKLFEAVHLWTHRVPGGLAVGTITMCIIFAASTGVVGATETVVGMLAIPILLKHNYNKGLISGTICAGGSLGTIIPPSVVPIVMGPIASVSVATLLVGMVFPGLIMGSLYIIYIIVRCYLRPQDGPIVKPDNEIKSLERWKITLTAIVPPLLMIFAVLGTIMFGIASPTEAAGLGAFTSLILAAFYRTLNVKVVIQALFNTLKITSMIMTIMLAGTMMASIFIVAGGGAITQSFVADIGLNRWVVIAIILFIIFLLGVFLDWMSIVLIMMPLAIPIVKQLGFSPEWFCIMFLIMLQTSYLTPPMAPAIFYLKGIAPPSIKTTDMFKGVIPFIFIQLLVAVILAIWPELVTWLPSKMLGFN